MDLKVAGSEFSELTKGRVVDALLTPNQYSRPQTPLEKIKGVVVHYTANQGTDAKANRNYFNNLPKINEKKDRKTYASSNFIIGIDGKILRVVPETEIAYASNDRNKDTLSIECCYVNENGSFTTPTYDSLVWLVSRICIAYQLNEEDVIRHYDVTGKNCPKYFVENQEAWNSFRQDIKTEITKAR